MLVAVLMRKIFDMVPLGIVSIIAKRNRSPSVVLFTQAKIGQFLAFHYHYFILPVNYTNFKKDFTFWVNNVYCHGDKLNILTPSQVFKLQKTCCNRR